MTAQRTDALSWSSGAGALQPGRPSTEPEAGHELLRMREWPLRSDLELRAQPASVRSARRHATTTLREWRMEALAGPVELLASELVTNAVRASAGRAAQIRFWLSSDRRSILIQVWDAGHRRPIRQAGGPGAESGRGLLIVEALSARWGCYVPERQAGKIVWAVCAR
jgi:anti-sigma regulatory factor (Ser/Thr protein kinase)